MIPDSAAAVMAQVPPKADWKHALANVIRSPAVLLARLGLDKDPAILQAAEQAAQRFPLRVPESYVQRMQTGNINDPLLRQVLPLGAELVPAAGYQADPVGDMQAMVTPGLLHKYQGRALLVMTGACAIHCRYCFRREFPYQHSSAKPNQWQQAIDYLKADSSIEELILSGGDPLSLTNATLAELLSALMEIPHLQRLRIHSRLAVVLPERIDQGLVDTLNKSGLQCIHVIHCNHANEIDKHVKNAIDKLKSANQLVLNQAVLLQGINDSAAEQIRLSKALTAIGVLPYYLHMLDKVNGAQHFDVAEPRALQIMATMQAQLPGYMLPKLVREIEGHVAKTPVIALQ